MSIKPIHFIAKYDYGSKSEQIKKQGPITKLFQYVVIKFLKPFIFQGASAILQKKLGIDMDRSAASKDQLKMIGGKNLSLKTPDGDVIDGMYLKASNFKQIIEKYFDKYEKDNGDGTVDQIFFIKPELCTVKTERTLNTNEEYDHLIPNEKEDILILEAFKQIGIEIYPFFTHPENDSQRGYGLELKKIPKNLPRLNENEGDQSHPTVLIAGGSAMPYASYKGLAAAYLMRGINVMMVDFRGFGKSEGSPSEQKTKLDLETAYQYLKEKEHLENQDLVVHGHCLGGGPAADLAARHGGVNLILDRTFAEYRDLARERFPIFKKIIHRIMPAIVNYNTAENLQKVKGNIAIAMSPTDKVIPEAQITKLIDHLPESQGQTMKLLDTKIGHVGNWAKEVKTSLQFNQFLEQAHLRRRLF